MLRHYKNVILLIEANVKDDYKKVNGGPFQVNFQSDSFLIRHFYSNIILDNEVDNWEFIQKFKGELSRRCRETRSLFTILVRAYPDMNVFWTLDPAHSCEMFEELKVNIFLYLFYINFLYMKFVHFFYFFTVTKKCLHKKENSKVNEYYALFSEFLT